MVYPFDFRKWCTLSYREENVTTYVAMDKNWIVAYMSIKVIPENQQAHLFHIFVDADYRNQGLAKMLLDHATHFANESKLTNITLHVFQKNDRAKHIYQQFGFLETGVTTGGNIKMEKELDLSTD